MQGIKTSCSTPSSLPQLTSLSGAGFFLQQFNTPCLSEFAYYIESNGEVAIIDPLRETKPYIEMAAARNAKIKYVIETHFHADFVSGHVDLAKETGAKIVYGPKASADFELYSAEDGEELPLGNIFFKVIHTPGHTLESTCYLLHDENKVPKCIFTGDTLFLGAVGRPDLAVKSDLTKEDLAGLLYDSLRNKIMPLPDDVIVYPAHGAGSACGKGISKGTSSSMLEQKTSNYALQPMTKEEFITIITANIANPPKYFFHDVAMNKSNYENLDSVLKRSVQALSIRQAQDLVSQGAIIIDCREIKDILETGIIPGSITISLALPFAVWVGTLLNPTDKLVVVCQKGKEEEVIIRLARVGFEQCQGFIEGGVQEWAKQEGKALDKIPVINAEEHVSETSSTSDTKILDVRNPPEWEGGIVDGSIRIPLGQLDGRLKELDNSKRTHILCKSGMRATIAYSLLRRGGFEDLALVQGGTDKLIEIGFKLKELTN